MYQSTTSSTTIMDNQWIAARELTPPPSETDIARERGAMQSGPPITMQPRSSLDSSSEANEQAGSFYDDDAGASGGIATVEGSAWSATNISRYVPLTGLDFLVAADYIYIQQTIELIDILTTVESENRYLVKARSGETLFVAAEQSSKIERQCCGSWRSFTIRIFDMNRQETLILTRPLAASLCCCPCYLQELNVYLTNGRQLGRIQQEWTVFIPEFIVQDCTGAEIYRLQGPNCCGCFMYAESDFKIMSRDGLVQLGTISHSWDDFLHSYTLGITFPSNASTESKALLVAASFLLEYMFYQKAKSKSWTRFLRLRL